MAKASFLHPFIYPLVVCTFLANLSRGDEGLTHEKPTPFQLDRQKLKDSGQQKFDDMEESLLTLAHQGKAFWQLGNGLDSMVSYCEAAHIDCSSVGQKALDIYYEKIMMEAWWKDDHGWWGELFVRLYDLTGDEEFLEAADLSFHYMKTSKDVWNEAPKKLQEQQPVRFDNGCFNTNLKDIDQNNGFIGIQNTVTNALFFKLALKLFEIHYHAYLETRSDEDGRLAADFWGDVIKQYRWFDEWFSTGLLNYDMTGDQQCLVEERVSEYKNGAITLGYEKNRAWIGDQGLVMSALYLFLENYHELSDANPLELDITDIDGVEIYNTGFSIASAVVWAMVETDTNLFIEYLEDDKDTFPFGDWDDYVPGPGIYTRNLTFLALNDPEYFKAFTEDDYKGAISANVSQALDNSSDIPNVAAFSSVASDLDQISTAIALGVPSFLKPVKPKTKAGNKRPKEIVEGLLKNQKLTPPTI